MYRLGMGSPPPRGIGWGEATYARDVRASRPGVGWGQATYTCV